MDYWGGGGGGGGGQRVCCPPPLSNYGGGLCCVNFSAEGILFVFSFHALIEWLFFGFTAHSDSISVYIGSSLRERESEK